MVPCLVMFVACVASLLVLLVFSVRVCCLCLYVYSVCCGSMVYVPCMLWVCCVCVFLVCMCVVCVGVLVFVFI